MNKFEINKYYPTQAYSFLHLQYQARVTRQYYVVHAQNWEKISTNFDNK
jgi:hypothetical protein